MRFVYALVMMVLTHGIAYAHELTPTYFELRPSIYNNVYLTDMTIFNRREDVRFYQIEVYDKDWNPVSFATSERIMEMRYLERRKFEIYIKKDDLDRVTYICTRSKLLKGGGPTVIASNICSKIKAP